MTVELRPLGVTCNLQCQYCYQHPQRDAGNVSQGYDMEKMKAGILAEGGPFLLFGGEPLLVPKPDLEDLWAWGYEHFGRNTVQTNATLIDDEHIALFRRYNVHVGVSMDGPGPLNDTRWFGSLERTRLATERSQAALERLCDEGLAPSMILTLHARNAGPDHLPSLLAWVEELIGRGLGSMRLHLLESETDTVRLTYALTEEQNIAAMRAFLRLSGRHPQFRIQPFSDMRRMLRGSDARTTCTWNGCDPYNTKAVQGVEGNGQRSNCGRTNKDGIDFEKAASRGMERSLALYNTPQSAGGCQGCRFFLMCKGQCPGTALDQDWRNRSEHCAVWKALYSDLEQEAIDQGEPPLSRSPNRLALELALTQAWHQGDEVRIARLHAATRGNRYARVDCAGPGRTTHRYPSDLPLSDLLDFQLPAFVRISWVNAPARAIWHDRLRRVRTAWERVEWLSVVDGVRGCAQLHPAVRKTVDVEQLAVRGLNMRRVAAFDVVGRKREIEEFTEAIAQRDHDSIGALLGYPACCIRSYVRAHTEQKLFDPTWTMALQSCRDPDVANAVGLAPDDPHSRAVAAVLDTNILWRLLGVRAVPHVPCSFDCQRTRGLGERMRRVFREHQLDEELDWLEEILNWPVEWSALHGIAEIKTPVLKLASRTDATANRYTVRRLGERYPPEGARGVRFPYKHGRARVTSSIAFRRGLRHAETGATTPASSPQSREPHG